MRRRNDIVAVGVAMHYMVNGIEADGVAIHWVGIEAVGVALHWVGIEADGVAMHWVVGGIVADGVAMHWVGVYPP